MRIDTAQTPMRFRDFYASVLLAALVVGCGSSAEMVTSSAPVVQPGAPGQATRVVAAESATEPKARPHTEADAVFMQGMIGHHAQALDMTALIADRSNHRDLYLLGQRIEISQKTEIAAMQKWLRDRGEDVPEATSHHMMAGHMEMMPGMLSPEQMEELRAALGDTFRELWIRFMIQHHQGAIDMVETLFATPGAGQETNIFNFATGVDEDQSMEIARMRAMLQD